MGGCNHHRCVETVLGSEIIDHWSGGQSHVVNVTAGIGDALRQRLEHGRGGETHVAADQYFFDI